MKKIYFILAFVLICDIILLNLDAYTDIDFIFTAVAFIGGGYLILRNRDGK